MHCIERYPGRLLTCVAAPAVEPVLLADAKAYLRVDVDGDDVFISGLIVAARQAAEEHMRRSLISQTWTLAFDWPPGAVTRGGWYFLGYERAACPLPKGPVQSVVSVTAYDAANNATVVDAALYQLTTAKDALVLVQSLAASRVEIAYVTGYGASASAVPKPIIYGILAHVGMLYDARGSAGVGLPPPSLALYAPYREVML